MENGVEFGGISGLDFDSATGHYLAISDDRSERGPARFYELNVDVDVSGLKAVSVVKQVTLKDKNGAPFAARTVDPESIRLGKDGIYGAVKATARRCLRPSSVSLRRTAPSSANSSCRRALRRPRTSRPVSATTSPSKISPSRPPAMFSSVSKPPSIRTARTLR